LIEGGNGMGGTGPKSAPPKNKSSGKDDRSGNKTPPAPAEDDDFEDGDIATPKRDRDGNDDEPL
jgi:hypothetical protein